MTGNTLRVRLETTDAFFDAISEDARAIENDEPLEDVQVLSVPDLATLDRVLSRTNLELIRAIAEHEPLSMRETARVVDRDIKNVNEDLHFLDELGLLSIETDGRSKRPIVPYDDIEVDIPVRSEDDGRRSATA